MAVRVLVESPRKYNNDGKSVVDARIVPVEAIQVSLEMLEQMQVQTSVDFHIPMVLPCLSLLVGGRNHPVQLGHSHLEHKSSILFSYMYSQHLNSSVPVWGCELKNLCFLILSINTKLKSIELCFSN